MILKNIYSLFHNDKIDLEIKNDLILNIGKSLSGINEIYFEDAMAFPGLINSHDHLDFNLFPKLGNSKFNNYTEWGPAIQSMYSSEIDSIIQIPGKERYNWGVLKNLLGGVTTVIHHGYKTLKNHTPIRIIDQFQHIHSVHFEKYWKLRLNNPFRRNQFCVIHNGEGTDQKAYHEIKELIRFNFLNRKIIAIHGVSMDVELANNFTALVWCPQSNDWMFGKTADIDKLKQVIPILFGTDSTLTSDWNIWDHIRDARKTQLLTDIELLQSLTTNGADIWNINSGSILPGKIADIVIAEKLYDDPFEAFYQLNPEKLLLVIHKGEIVLADEQVKSNIPPDIWNNLLLKPIIVNERIKYIPAQFFETIIEIKRYAYVSLPIKIVSNGIAC